VVDGVSSTHVWRNGWGLLDITVLKFPFSRRKFHVMEFCSLPRNGQGNYNAEPLGVSSCSHLRIVDLVVFGVISSTKGGEKHKNFSSFLFFLAADLFLSWMCIL
jgi:hypothetical protein